MVSVSFAAGSCSAGYVFPVLPADTQTLADHTASTSFHHWKSIEWEKSGAITDLLG